VIAAGCGFEWKMFCELVASHIFCRSDTSLYRGAGGASSFRELVKHDFDKDLLARDQWSLRRPSGCTRMMTTVVF
jgi:hypothetical protein